MSLATRFERRLESLVGGAFARVFKGQVEPVEIGGALQREAGDKRNVMPNGQVLSPNRYRVTLSPSDHDRLMPWEAQLTNSLAELVQDSLDENGWSTIGDVEVFLARDDELHTGVFGVASRMEPAAPDRRRPHDSLSLPVVPGVAPDDYARQAQAAGLEPAVPPAPTWSPDPQAYAPPAPDFAPPANGYAGPGPDDGTRAYLPPTAAPRRQAATLVVDQSDRRYPLHRGSNVVGRGTGSDLQLLDQGISRQHVDIRYDGDFATAYDMGSTNGTVVNGHEITSVVLSHGDVIKVGHTRIVFHQER